MTKTTYCGGREMVQNPTRSLAIHLFETIDDQLRHDVIRNQSAALQRLADGVSMRASCLMMVKRKQFKFKKSEPKISNKKLQKSAA
jgi:hypothetical protein